MLERISDGFQITEKNKREILEGDKLEAHRGILYLEFSAFVM